jgi:hypothetical protein
LFDRGFINSDWVGEESISPNGAARAMRVRIACACPCRHFVEVNYCPEKICRMSKGDRSPDINRDNNAAP